MLGHCCQSRILHPLFLPLMQSASSLRSMLFCSQNRLLIWHENLVWFCLFSKITHYISGCNFCSSNHMLYLLFPSWSPGQYREPARSVPLLHIPVQHHSASCLLSFPGLSALCVCNQTLLLSIHMMPTRSPKNKTKQTPSDSLVLSRRDGAASSWELPAVVSKQFIQPVLCLLFIL